MSALPFDLNDEGKCPGCGVIASGWMLKKHIKQKHPELCSECGRGRQEFNLYCSH